MSGSRNRGLRAAAIEQSLAEIGHGSGDPESMSAASGRVLREETGGWLRQAVENVLWLMAAGFVIYYGDAKKNLVEIVWHDRRIRRLELSAAALCIFINVAIFLYLSLWRRLFQQPAFDWRVEAPAAIQAATGLGILSGVLLTIAFWPVWGILSLPLLFVLFMAFVIISPYIPPYGASKRAKERAV